MSFLNTKAALSVLLGLLLLLAACGDDSTGTTTTTPRIPDTLKVRAMHLSYDAPAVDVFLGGASSASFTNLAYGSATDYVKVDAGTLNVQMRPSGSTQTVINFDAPLEDEILYTFYAIDQLSNLDGVFTADERGDTTFAKVRVVHAVPDAPRVDMIGTYISTSGDTIPETIALDLPFKRASFYANVDSASYNFVLTLAGDTTVVASFEPIVLTNDGVYSIVLRGTLNDPTAPFEATVFIDSGDGSESVELGILP